MMELLAYLAENDTPHALHLLMLCSVNDFLHNVGLSYLTNSGTLHVDFYATCFNTGAT